MQKWTLLKVNVQTVGETMLFFADEMVLVDAEWESNLIDSALAPAGERCVTDLLREAQ